MMFVTIHLLAVKVLEDLTRLFLKRWHATAILLLQILDLCLILSDLLLDAAVITLSHFVRWGYSRRMREFAGDSISVLMPSCL